MPKNFEEQYRYTQNRELSWLRFDRRVLEEAADPGVPALERLKFVSIFSSNLDEFFMVRVGSLFDLAHMTPDNTDNKTGWTPAEQLHHIYRVIPGLLAMKQQIYAAVIDDLARSGVQDVLSEALGTDDLKRVNRFFKTELLPVLSPIVIAPNHPVPHLVNKRLYAAALLESKKGHRAVGIVPVPDSAPPYLLLTDGKRFVRTENILLRWLPTLFDAYTVRESCILAVTRNADISFDDEKFEDNEEDFRRQMKKLLKQRDHLAVVRLELGRTVSEEFQKILFMLVRVQTHQVFVDECPLNMRYVFRLIGELPKERSSRLLYPSYRPRWAEDLWQNQSILAQVQQKDRLLFYPYDSVEPFLRLLNEAADDPHVLSIKIAIYRLASSSKIAQTLCRAAENGKEVLVLMELRARFDEENNLVWSKMLEESGCQVIYGAEGFKCHSKICLITLRSRNKTSYLTQIGTGNYNEKTNAMYTDLCLMTANPAIGEDAAAFFRNMLVNKLDGEYQQLCVSPFGIKDFYWCCLRCCYRSAICSGRTALPICSRNAIPLQFFAAIPPRTTRTQSQRRFIRRIPRSSSRSWTFSPIILITVLSGRWQAQTIRVAITQVSGFTFIWITATTVWISPAAARARSSSTALSGTSATGVIAQSLP